MPASIHLFGRASLVDPIEVNVGRAGAGNIHVILILISFWCSFDGCFARD